jgi:hypothetical protein
MNHARVQKHYARERGLARGVTNGQTTGPEAGPEPKNENDPHPGPAPVKGPVKCPGKDPVKGQRRIRLRRMPGIGVVRPFAQGRIPGPVILGQVKEGVRYGA